MAFTTKTESIEPLIFPAFLRAASISKFERIGRLSGCAPLNEWMAVLPDETEVVVPEAENQPSPLAVQKAISIVQSRSYLGKRAVQLISPFIREDGKWRLLTIDFGAEARRYESEFLMCFAFVATHAKLSTSSPYFEVGFALPTGLLTEDEPTFNLTVKAIVGMPMPFL